MTDNRTVLDEAHFYAARGWRVVPILPGQKRPALDAWVERATTDHVLIDDWWRAHPDHGVGIVTGEQSGLFVLDIDPEHGGDDTLADLEHTHGPLADTIETITGSGGRHILFTWPGWNPGTNAGQLGPGLDLRAEGGQIVAPPTIHPNGRPYMWELAHDPHDGLAVAAAPDWLLELLKPLAAVTPRRDIAAYTGDPRPGDRFAANVTWPELLERDGAQCVDRRTDRKTNSDYELWTRPGKNARDGASASLYYGGTDLLKVFTTNWPGLTEGQTYTRFGYLTATRYHGDHRAAARALADVEGDQTRVATWIAGLPDIETAVTAPAENVEDVDALPTPIVWSEFWQRDTTPNEWLCEPFLPAGRQVAFYAPAKLGKSLLAFEVAAALATGQPVLGRPASDPIPVMYVDLEMTPDDVEERLDAMGYGPESDLDRLHYYSLPFFGPLDEAAGANGVMKRALQHEARLVVIDTMARAVAGEENSADTYRAFYRHLGMSLKAAGIALLRIDHTGKDISRGQRGSSEKVGDVDLVWRLASVDRDAGLFDVIATHRRITWAPDKFQIVRHDEPLAHKLASSETWPGGTSEIAAELDALDVPIDAPTRVAQAALKKAGGGRRRQLVVAAMKWRQERGTARGTTRTVNSGTESPENVLTRNGTAAEPPEPHIESNPVFPPPIGGNHRDRPSAEDLI